MGLVAAAEVLLAGGFLCLLCSRVHMGVCSLIPAANANEKVIPHPIFQKDSKKADHYI